VCDLIAQNSIFTFSMLFV